MDRVEFVEGSDVDKFEDRFLGHEVPGDIHHEAAPFESGMVIDGDSGDFPCLFGVDRGFSVDVGGKELPERLESVEEAGFVGCGYGDECRFDVEPISFGEELRVCFH